MADLATLFPTPNIDQTGYFGGLMMGDQFNIAKQNALINQQRAQSEEQRTQQMHPLDMLMKQNQAEYQGALARNTNQQADKGAFELDQAKRLAEPTYQTALKKLSAESDDAELKATHARLEKDLISPDPQVRQQAQQMYYITGDMLKLKSQEDTKIKVANIQASATMGAAQARAAGQGGGAKIPKSPRELMSFYDYKANTASTPEEAAHFQKLAQEQEVLFQKELLLRAQAAQGGKVDIGAAANVPTQPMPQATPTPRGQIPTAAPAAPASQYEVGKTYTGSTGTYRYKGGDPANKANWEKM